MLTVFVCGLLIGTILAWISVAVGKNFILNKLEEEDGLLWEDKKCKRE